MIDYKNDIDAAIEKIDTHEMKYLKIPNLNKLTEGDSEILLSFSDFTDGSGNTIFLSLNVEISKVDFLELNNSCFPSEKNAIYYTGILKDIYKDHCWENTQWVRLKDQEIEIMQIEDDTYLVIADFQNYFFGTPELIDFCEEEVDYSNYEE